MYKAIPANRNIKKDTILPTHETNINVLQLHDQIGFAI